MLKYERRYILLIPIVLPEQAPLQERTILRLARPFVIHTNGWITCTSWDDRIDIHADTLF